MPNQESQIETQALTARYCNIAIAVRQTLDTLDLPEVVATLQEDISNCGSRLEALLEFSNGVFVLTQGGLKEKDEEVQQRFSTLESLIRGYCIHEDCSGTPVGIGYIKHGDQNYLFFLLNPDDPKKSVRSCVMVPFLDRTDISTSPNKHYLYVQNWTADQDLSSTNAGVKRLIFDSLAGP